MSTSKTGACKRDLVKGAVNLNMGNGYVVYLSEDGDMLLRRPVEATGFKTSDVMPSTFLRAVGFTIDNSQDMNAALMITVKLFTFIGHIKFSHFRSIVKSIDAAIHEPGSIGVY